MAKTFEKVNTKKAPKSKQKTFDVLVIIRHTRAGDVRCAVYDYRNEKCIDYTMNRAEEIANDAARNYGYGSTSVYKAKLKLLGGPLQPKKEY